jgi:2'-5' RNA ligase
VKAENFHVTVRFLGEIDPMLTLELEQRCREITKRTTPFDLSIDHFGAFPSLVRARVLWAGGEAPQGFVDFVFSLNKELEKIGFEQDRKATVAHITLARITGGGDPSMERVIRSLDGWRGYTLRADRLILMESQLSPQGAVYYPLFTLPFGG